MLEKVVLPNGRVIFGAIYIWNHKLKKATELAPKVVLAFRGMLPGWDGIVDLSTPSSTRKLSAMLKVAMDKVISVRQLSNHGKVGLCGHSLGAATALILGKCLASSCIYLETFLFNPPIVLDYLWHGIVDRESMGINPISLHAWDMFALAKEHWFPKESKKFFRNLVKWKPRLLVNAEDVICNGYIDYYGTRNTKEDACYLEYGLPFVTPSALVVVNDESTQECHEIKQWWNHNLSEGPCLRFDEDYTLIIEVSG